MPGLDFTHKAQHSLQPRHSSSLSRVFPGKFSWNLNLNLIRKTGEAQDRNHDPWFTRRVALPLHHNGFLSTMIYTYVFHVLGALSLSCKPTHHENKSVQRTSPYTPLLNSKTGAYRGIHFFLIFAPKHRLWVLVRTASLRRF